MSIWKPAYQRSVNRWIPHLKSTLTVPKASRRMWYCSLLLCQLVFTSHFWHSCLYFLCCNRQLESEQFFYRGDFQGDCRSSGAGSAGTEGSDSRRHLHLWLGRHLTAACLACHPQHCKTDCGALSGEFNSGHFPLFRRFHILPGLRLYWTRKIVAYAMLDVIIC